MASKGSGRGGGKPDSGNAAEDAGGYRIRERGGDKRVYVNPDKGWHQDNPPPESDQLEDAMTFPTEDAAKKYIREHGMDAEPEEV